LILLARSNGFEPITTALKGQIELASTPGSGTKVTLRFPRTIAD
jgi:signal transduction histidine kinase